MVIKMEAHPEATQEMVRQAMVDRIFGEIVKESTGGLVDLEGSWERQPPSDREEKIGIRVAQLCCDGDPTTVRIEQSEHWALDAPGIKVLKEDEPVFVGTIDNALGYIETRLGHKV